jgi:hypothetical protein
MIYTVRQLEDIWKANGSNGQVVLPYRARLSPLASDWIKSKKLTLGYSDTTPAPAPISPLTGHSPLTTGHFLYWCDGPCGTAKAALMGQARESSLAELGVSGDPKKIVPAIKDLANQVKSAKAAGGILMVNSAAVALILSNRCPSLRAVVGTCIETVEQGIQQAAANVLIIEYPHKTLQQIRNLLSRFTKAKRELSDEMKQAIQEMTTCG